jgi:N-acetylglucosaminyldiphosphoundecaprenol N-acetyl-beta-D-mannosaminyltransferase
MEAVAPERIQILGLPVDRVTMPQAIERIESFLAEDRFHLVLTADSSMLVLGSEEPEMAAIFHEASLVTPDSVGVLWAARRKGTPLPEKVSGVDLVDHLCAGSARHGYSIYFLGAAPGVAEEAAAALRKRHPGCRILGCRDGYFPKSQDAEVASEIGKLHPDILLVAMGIPRQEKFLVAQAERHRARVGIGVGGSFDVYSGRVKRAPKLLQRLSLEWLWRLLLNPKKLPKAATLPRFVWKVWRHG